MAQSLATKKVEALRAFVALSLKAEAMARDIKELQTYFTDNGFLTGGGNAIVDADCVGDYAHLTASLVNSGITAIATVALSTGNATILRQIASSPTLPTS